MGRFPGNKALPGKIGGANPFQLHKGGPKKSFHQGILGLKVNNPKGRGKASK